LIVGTGLAAGVRRLITSDHAWSGRLAAMAARIAVVQTSEHLPFP
jgi:hypothetical protein